MSKVVPAAPRHGLTLLLAAGLVVTTGCGDTLVDGPTSDSGNVETRVGVVVAESDTGVTVDGETRVRHPNGTRAVWVDRFERYDFGTTPTLAITPPTRYGLSWRVMLTHEQPREERGDSLILGFYDHGEARIGGMVMDRLDDPPAVGPGAPVRFDSFVRYTASTFVRVEWQTGEAETFRHAPFHDDLVAGQPVILATSGSDQALPLEAAVTLRPFALLTGLANRGELSLGGNDAPIVDARHPLALDFSRPLDPERAYIVLHPVNAGGGTTAFVQPRAATYRVVIPALLLRTLAGAGAAAPVAYRVVIVEFHTEDDAIGGHLTDATPEPGSFTLPLVQRSETVVNVRLAGAP